MKIKLFLIRKAKGLFLKLRLHLMFEPFAGALLNLSYLSKFSKWRRQIDPPKHDDFFSGKFDYQNRYALYDYLLKSEGLEGPIDYMEFGVAKGRSFEWWKTNNNNPDSRFVGFDTFTGLPESWRMFKKGDMSAGGKVPDANDLRCEFQVGLFQDTLPNFLKNYPGNRKAIYHLDADLYTSTLYVLTTLARFFKEGDILIFDEFGVPLHEFRAFNDFISSYYLKYKVIAASNNYYQVSIKFT